MIDIRVIFLGPARDLACATELALQVPRGSTISDLEGELAGRYERLAPALPTMQFARNQSYAQREEQLANGDEVALIPPVSGGSSDSIWCDLLAGPIRVDEVQRFMEGCRESGAVTTFEGRTRADSDPVHGLIVRLEYEAYDEMALSELRRLATQALDRWSLKRIVLLHRIGTVPLSQPSVVISVASAHRAEGFDACRWMIDTLKQVVPIWKKDVFADGFTEWVKPQG